MQPNSAFNARRSPRLARSPGNVLTPKADTSMGYSTDNSFYTPPQAADGAENEAPNSVVFSSGAASRKSPGLRRRTASPMLPPVSPAPAARSAKKGRRRTASPGALASLMADLDNSAASSAMSSPEGEALVAPASPASPEDDSIAARVRARSPSPARRAASPSPARRAASPSPARPAAQQSAKRSQRRRTASPGAMSTLLSELDNSGASEATPSPVPAPKAKQSNKRSQRRRTASPDAMSALMADLDDSAEATPEPAPIAARTRARSPSPARLSVPVPRREQDADLPDTPEPVPVAARTRARSPSPMRAVTLDAEEPARPAKQRRKTVSPGAMDSLMAELDESATEPVAVPARRATVSPGAMAAFEQTEELDVPMGNANARRATVSPGAMAAFEETEELDVPVKRETPEEPEQSQQRKKKARRNTASPSAFEALAAGLDDSGEASERRVTASPSAVAAFMAESDAEAEAEEEPAGLKSCLRNAANKTPARNVAFGSPNVAEFNKHSPTTSMTPMERGAAKLLFPVEGGAAPASSEEGEDEATERNSNILDAWDSIDDSGDEKRVLSFEEAEEQPAAKDSDLFNYSASSQETSMDATDQSAGSNTVELETNLGDLINESADDDDDDKPQLDEDDRTVELEGNLGALMAKLGQTPSPGASQEGERLSRLMLSASRDVSADIESQEAAFALKQRLQRLKTPAQESLFPTPYTAGTNATPASLQQLPTPILPSPEADSLDISRDLSASLDAANAEDVLPVEAVLAAVENEPEDEASIWGRAAVEAFESQDELAERVWLAAVVAPRLAHVQRTAAALDAIVDKAESDVGVWTAYYDEHRGELNADAVEHAVAARAPTVRARTRADGWDRWDLELARAISAELAPQKQALRHVLAQFERAAPRMQRATAKLQERTDARRAERLAALTDELADKARELAAAHAAAEQLDADAFEADAELAELRARRDAAQAAIRATEEETAACHAAAEERRAALAASTSTTTTASLPDDVPPEAVAAVAEQSELLDAQRGLMLWQARSLQVPELEFVAGPTTLRVTVSEADGATVTGRALTYSGPAGGLLEGLWRASTLAAVIDGLAQLSQLPAALQELETRLGRMNALHAELEAAGKRHDVTVLPVACGAARVQVQALGRKTLCVSTVAVPIASYPFVAPALADFQAKWGGSRDAAVAAVERVQPGFGLVEGAVGGLTRL